jgi:hypothetical protein
MHKSQGKGNMAPPKYSDTSITDSKDTEMNENDFRSLLKKMTSKMFQQTVELNRKSIQDLGGKVSNMDEKFRRDSEILKKKRKF